MNFPMSSLYKDEKMPIEITNNYSNYTSGYANAVNSKKQAAESKAAT